MGRHTADGMEAPVGKLTANKAPCPCRGLCALADVAGIRTADERTRTAVLISLRVIGQVLRGVVPACKSRIPKGISLLRLAQCCTVLRSRWYQNGIKSVLVFAYRHLPPLVLARSHRASLVLRSYPRVRSRAADKLRFPHRCVSQARRRGRRRRSGPLPPRPRPSPSRNHQP